MKSKVFSSFFTRHLQDINNWLFRLYWLQQLQKARREFTQNSSAHHNLSARSSVCNIQKKSFLMTEYNFRLDFLKKRLQMSPRRNLVHSKIFSQLWKDLLTFPHPGLLTFTARNLSSKILQEKQVSSLWGVLLTEPLHQQGWRLSLLPPASLSPHQHIPKVGVWIRCNKILVI